MRLLLNGGEEAELGKGPYQACQPQKQEEEEEEKEDEHAAGPQCLCLSTTCMPS